MFMLIFYVIFKKKILDIFNVNHSHCKGENHYYVIWSNISIDKQK